MVLLLFAPSACYQVADWPSVSCADMVTAEFHQPEACLQMANKPIFKEVILKWYFNNKLSLQCLVA